MRRLAGPFVASLVLLAILGGAGLVVIVLAWRGASVQAAVADQVPFLVSGGIAGVALAGFAAGGLMIQHRRLLEARRRAAFAQVIRGAGALLVAARRDTVIER